MEEPKVEIPVNTGEIQEKEKKVDNPQLFKPGQSGNPAGRPKGSKNFNTLFVNAVKRIAETNKVKPEEIDLNMITQAIEKATDGDFKFFQYIYDRRFGKPLNKIDLTSDKEKITDIKVTYVDEIKKDEIKPSGNESVEGEHGSPPKQEV